ncbi:hypothetical protein V7128_05600 [Neobacillus vireti]|uniref:hypothetical protein n=1 Tax=Neobacillus vireti TaxID=220686 RepID=UPI002FFF7E44
MKYEVGDRVKVNIRNKTSWLKLKDAPATIFYIDHKTLYAHHLRPIQVELDDPYDEHGQTMLRVSVKEIKPLKIIV